MACDFGKVRSVREINPIVTVIVAGRGGAPFWSCFYDKEPKNVRVSNSGTVRM
jgi:hypothetical protein